MKHPNHIYTWRSPSGKYFYSKRAGNNKTNAIYTSPGYGSRSGRNYMVNQEIERAKKAKEPAPIVHRSEKPPKK